MKFTVNVFKGIKSLAIFEFKIHDARESDYAKLLEIEHWLNDRTDVRFHIHDVAEVELPKGDDIRW